MVVGGVDSSTQSTKVAVGRGDDGTVLDQRSGGHPVGTECDPAAWWAALWEAGGDLLHRAAAVGGAGQQHGMIVLDHARQVIRPPLLWNGLRSAGAPAELVTQPRGADRAGTPPGSVPPASVT